MSSQDTIDALAQQMQITVDLVDELESERARIRAKAMPARMRESYMKYLKRGRYQR